MWCQKLQGLVTRCKTLLPREKSRPLIRMITELGSFCIESPPRRLAVTDACIKRASNRMPPTNFTAIDDDVDVDVDVRQNEDASGHIEVDEKHK